MANTYTQIYIQIVFAVTAREQLIPRDRREDLHKYITGILKNHGQKMLAIFAMPDHIHLLAGFRPSLSISDLVQNIKTGSTNHINDQRWLPKHFSWQTGFGAFSYGHDQIDRVIKYILNQEEHHRKKSFREEYKEMLAEFDIKYDDRYLFSDVLTK